MMSQWLKTSKQSLQANKKYSYLLLLDYMVTKGKLSVTGYYKKRLPLGSDGARL